MKKLLQHYRNSKKWDDSLWFIIKMALMGKLLTNEWYYSYCKEKFDDNN